MITAKEKELLKFVDIRTTLDKSRTSIQVYTISNQSFIGTVIVHHAIKRVAFWQSPDLPEMLNVFNEINEYIKELNEDLTKKTGLVHEKAVYNFDIEYEVHQEIPKKDGTVEIVKVK